MSAEVTENILYMKLLHELKAAFPAVSDDVVRHAILQASPFRSRHGIDFVTQFRPKLFKINFRLKFSKKFTPKAFTNICDYYAQLDLKVF
jgi:hypothetical protein